MSAVPPSYAAVVDLVLETGHQRLQRHVTAQHCIDMARELIRLAREMDPELPDVLPIAKIAKG